jgi:hypothetical protein
MYEHRIGFKQWKEGKSAYISSFEILKHEDAYIELLELYPCTMKIEIHAREGKWIREMNCVNKQVAGRTRAEWCQDNKEHYKAYKAEYYQKNKDKIRTTNDKYYQRNKEVITAYRTEWYQKNKDKVRDRQTERYQKNRDTILAKAAERVQCQCGSIISRRNLSTHKKSMKHRLYILDSHNELNHITL